MIHLARSSTRALHRYTTPVLGRDGRYFGRIWAYRDITERKQAEEARRASEARYRTLFDCAPDGILIGNPEGYYLDGNESMCRMLGYAQHRDGIAVVLTDMAMPIMDGVATVHALRRVNPTVKIIAASGLDANGGTNKGPKANVKYFLAKPYTAETLLRILRTVLDEARGA
jgi:PAS domain-containing protein